jgi:Uma2 family endonuclease
LNSAAIEDPLEKTMAAITPISPEPIDDVYYPAEDGEPMAETHIHVEAILNFREYLTDLFSDRPDIFIGTDQFWYWERGNNKACRAPDIMVCFGVVPRTDFRRSFFTWLENDVIPQLICEFSSESAWGDDLGEKLKEFERLGVKEYFLFDPEAMYLQLPLQGFRLRSGKYQPIKANSDGSLTSKELNLRIIVADQYNIRPLDAAGNRIPNRLERAEKAEKHAEQADKQTDEAKRQEELARKQADEAKRQEELARKQADEARKLAEDASQRLRDAERQIKEAAEKAAAKDAEIA